MVSAKKVTYFSFKEQYVVMLHMMVFWAVMILVLLKYCRTYLLQFNPVVIQGFYGHFR